MAKGCPAVNYSTLYTVYNWLSRCFFCCLCLMKFVTRTEKMPIVYFGFQAQKKPGLTPLKDTFPDFFKPMV